jgi:hypothetical protein
MVVFTNANDMAARQVEPDSLVEMESVTEGGDVRRTAGGFKARPYNIPRGSIAAYYPETNGLLPLSYHDKKSKTLSAKSIPVVVRPMAGRAAAQAWGWRRRLIDLGLDVQIRAARRTENGFGSGHPALDFCA